jgi:hypothetical protein
LTGSASLCAPITEFDSAMQNPPGSTVIDDRGLDDLSRLFRTPKGVPPWDDDALMPEDWPRSP